ncbi:MAG: MSHA biogenesis protein MshJ [Herbaspirillum sp.]
MKQSWEKLSLRIDAMTLRERVLIFIMVAAVVLVIVNMALLNPQFTKQKKMSEQITAEQIQITAIQADIQQKVRARAVDPDADTRQQLTQMQQQSDRLRGSLQQTQKALVSPEKMPALLQALLKRDGKLKLVALKTLPVSGLADTAHVTTVAGALTTVPIQTAATTTAVTTPANAADGLGVVYRHGVEITVLGTYADMLHYMTELEAMPWQLYWGRAKLQVESYPENRLTLTLYTLSLDKKWMNL